jgi:hypothetical protein
MAGCGFFSAGRQHAKVLLTARYRPSNQVTDFIRGGFTNRAAGGRLKPEQSGEFVNPKCAGAPPTITGDIIVYSGISNAIPDITVLITPAAQKKEAPRAAAAVHGAKECLRHETYTRPARQATQ